MARGWQVKTLEDLARLRKERRAVIGLDPSSVTKPLPAAIVLNMPGSVILSRIYFGLYVYEKPKAKEEPDGTVASETGL